MVSFGKMSLQLKEGKMRRLGLLHPTKVKLQLQVAIWQLVVASDELKLGQATANLYKGCFYCGIYLFYGR